jgi:hypothetical protein
MDKTLILNKLSEWKNFATRGQFAKSSEISKFDA